MKTFLKQKIQLGIISSILLIIVFSIGTAYFMINVAPENTKEFFAMTEKYPALIWLNYIPIPLCMILLYFLFNNALLSVFICSGIFSLMAVVNNVKIQMRQDPFIPSDITLINEVKAIFTSFDESYIKTATTAIIIFVVLILISLIFFKGKKMDNMVRFTCFISTLAIMMCIHFSVYASSSYYDSFKIKGNYYFKVNHYESKGFLYSFVHDIHTLSVKKPVGYDKTVYEKMENKTKIPNSLKTKEKPHIIMIMGEAFSDLSENENIDFKGYRDPLKNFKELSKSDNAVSGHIVVPNFGGGTSDTEFDVLTACSTRFIDNPLSSYSFVRKDFDAIPSILDTIGYDSVAIHPGYSWFYNRYNVYNYFGFDKSIFLEDNFEPVTQNKGMYISDEATTDKIIENFEEHIENSDNPLFTFCVTIQNHGPYEEKYGFDGRNFNTDMELTDHQTSIMGNYFEGVKDADKELGRLTDYFEDNDEPVVIVYFGDHLPGFSNGTENFEALEYDINLNGTKEEYLNAYKTPFLIWENDSAKEITDIKEVEKTLNLPEDMTISSNYLGSLVMELMGYERLYPLWQFSNNIMEEVPVVTEYFYVNNKGEITEKLPEKETEDVNLLKGWAYYKLFDEQ